MSDSTKHPEASSQLAQGSNQTTRRHPTKLTPRLKRLARALINGPISTFALKDLIPANNAPAYVSTLKQKANIEIHCEHVPCVTADGESSWYGIYSIRNDDQKKLIELIGRG